MNILTFDIEEWFHLLDFDATRTEECWDKYPVRIHENVDRVLDILEQTDTKATFFVIGWIAKKYPEVVRKIASKYQIGCHSMNHQLVWQQTPDQFKADTETCIHLLEDITGQPVECYRAPGFSIRETEPWAIDILASLGIQYDCSVFPARHAHGGMPSYGLARPSIIRHGGCSLREFPVSTKRLFGKNVIFNGGGYFRLTPYSMIKKWSQDLVQEFDTCAGFTDEKGYILSYIHPRDLDAGQPVLEGLPLSRKFKSYVGLKGSTGKLRRYLTDFSFTDIASASKTIDWDNSPQIDI